MRMLVACTQQHLSGMRRKGKNLDNKRLARLDCVQEELGLWVTQASGWSDRVDVGAHN